MGQRHGEDVRGFDFATIDTISTIALAAATRPCDQAASLLARRSHRQRNSVGIVIPVGWLLGRESIF